MCPNLQIRLNLLLSLFLGTALILLTGLTGSADAVDPSNIQDNLGAPASFADAQVIGQTLVPAHARLHALEVRWIVSSDFQPSLGARITLHLRNAVTDTTDVATVDLPLAGARNDEFAKFVFSPLPNSAQRSFYFAFTLSPAAIQQGSLSLWASDQDAYPDGSLYVNGMATDRDLSFRAYYEPDLFMWLGELAQVVGRYSGVLIPTLLLFLLPGVALARLLGTESIAALPGLGLAAMAASTLFFLVSPTVGRVFILACAVIALLFLLRSRGRLLPFSYPKPGAAWLLAPLALAATLVGLLQIRDAPVPLWVDSLAHAQIIQSFVSAGQLPSNDFYHLGYHVATGLLVRLSGMSIPSAMLLMGPLFLLQTGLSVFYFSRRLSASPVAGLASVLCVWFLSPLPAYLTTWGRYPLLMGAALLPLAHVAGMDWMDKPRWSWRSFALMLLLFAGLALTHVRLVLFYAVFVLVYAIYGMARGRERRARLYRLTVQLGLVLGVGLVWLVIVLVRGLTWQRLLEINAAAPAIDVASTIAILLSHHGPELVALALAATLVGMVRRSKAMILMWAWFALLSLVASLPTEMTGAPITPDLVVLMAFIPLAVLVGDTTAWLWDKLSRENARSLAVIWTAAAAIIMLIGARDNASVVNPATILFTPADTPAVEWIQNHTPAHARFLVNSFNWYASTYVPSDGGAWIPFLTGRSIEFLSADTGGWGRDHAHAWLAAHPVDYVYLGRSGSVLSRREFSCQPELFRLAYSGQGIEIYSIVTDGVAAPGARPLECDSFG